MGARPLTTPCGVLPVALRDGVELYRAASYPTRIVSSARGRPSIRIALADFDHLPVVARNDPKPAVGLRSRRDILCVYRPVAPSG